MEKISSSVCLEEENDLLDEFAQDRTLLEPRDVTGPVTLAIGVAVSMFSAVVVTRTFLRILAGTRLAQKISLFSVYSGRTND